MNRSLNEAWGPAPSQGHAVPPRTSLDDVFNGYRLFLGRHPRNAQEAMAAVDCTLPEFFGQYLMRGEFLGGVADGLTGHQVLPHVTLAPAPDDALARWATDRLPLSADGRDRLSASRSWRFWLLTILRDETFHAMLPAAVADWFLRSGLRDRVAAVELAPTRQLVGEVSHSSAGTISGWCANTQDFSERVVLELSLGGRFVGAVRCDRFVPGLGERIGGSGEHGFVYDIPREHAELAARGATLRVCDAHSKAQFGGDIYVKANLPGALDDLGRMLSAIQSVKDLLANLEQHLPHAIRQVSPPPSAYGELKAQAILSCNRPAIGRDATMDTGTGTAVNVILLETALAAAPVRRLLASLESQRQDRWTLTVLAAGGEDGADGRANGRTAASLGDEIGALIHPLEAQGRAVVAAPAALPRLVAGHPALAAGAHLVVGCAGTLREDAIATLLAALEPGTAQQAAVAYSDHDTMVDPRNGTPRQTIPLFKPDFDPIMLLACDYAGPMVMVTPEALLKAFAIANGEPPSSLHDLMLRLSDCISPDRVRHIPSVLYSLEQAADPRSPDGLPRLLTGDPAAVEAWAGRRGLAMTVRTAPLAGDDGQTLVEPCGIDPRPAAFPTVSVIVPTRNAPVLLRNCLDSLLRVRQAYPAPMQILVIDHQNEDPDSVALIAAMRDQRNVDVMPYRGPFNWADMNNLAAARATGEVLVFLNDDTMAADPRWLSRAVATLGLPGVGIVGARLLYGDGSIQHAGIVTSIEQGAIHETGGDAGTGSGYLGRNLILRSAAAVTGACLITRRTLFETVGGFDASWPTNWNDVIYCLAARRAGWRVVYDPSACLYHLESRTRGYFFGQAGSGTHRSDLDRLRAEWGALLDDPFHNRAFNRMAAPFTRMML
ncbi:glycosyltransferase [Azospirillum sp. Sh1]|uniref:glycosyltransferase family 2 protein n=1 Tax=Azospirillum sp. Sh1 TaxID=2607285 RepID=UPI00165DC5A0|nr:glycosyltransferase [Azospirillum sp. Sh1]